MATNYKTLMQIYRDAVEEYLDGCFCDETLPQKHLFDSMRYSLLAGGKRIRPVLVLEFCRVCGGNWEDALPFAAAIEMVHTYSLIHDDLPCMDNDDYRRGRLTNHKIFGEAGAILAGDALLTAAFGKAASATVPPERIVGVIRILSEAAGELGMVGGQVLDMDGAANRGSENMVQTIHRLKTGALISAACRMGAAAAGASEEQIAAAGAYAEALGLAFQIRDDMLDVLGDSEKMGKATNTDANKTTFVSVYGIGNCARLIEEENKKAIEALSVFEDRDFLVQLTNLLAFREN